MPATTETGTDVAARLLVEHASPLVDAGRAGTLPPTVADAADDLRGALLDVIEAGVQLERDRAELTRRKDLMPEDGYRRLWNEATDEARTRADEAERAAERAYQTLELALSEAMLPTFEPSRETLARDEAALALSGGGNIEGAALTLANHGNAEAVAALLSPWGSTLLRSRGVTDPERLLRDVRKVAVARAIDHAEHPAAIAYREHFGAIGAAKGGAGANVRRMTRR